MNLKPVDAAYLIAQTRSDRTVLVGGQAVAFWIRHFNIPARIAALTRDIDYLGTKSEAKRASDRLKLPHRLKVATMDDAAPNSAMLSVDMEGYAAPIQIEYLAEIIGLTSKEITSSAVTIAFEEESLRILHPLHLLQSKIWNLYRLKEKQTSEGIEQARLAIEIAASFIETAEISQRDVLKSIETIGRFAATAPARFVRENYKLDCLKAVPPALFKDGPLPAAFLEKRWPQILAAAK